MPLAFRRLLRKAACNTRRAVSRGFATYAFDTPKGGKGRSVRFKAGAARQMRATRPGNKKKRCASAPCTWTATSSSPSKKAAYSYLRRCGSTSRGCFSSTAHPGSPSTPSHTAATLMLENSEHPKVVQEMLGHANIPQTLGTYPHVTLNIQSEAAERLDSVLF
jgi:site-specific recombinase XerD